MRAFERAFEGILRSFYEWVSLVELSPGRLHANPLISFFSCLAVVSTISFSSKVTQILLSVSLSCLILLLCDIRGFKRSLKVSIIWLAFTSIIMLPRIAQDSGALVVPMRVAAALLALNSFIGLVGTKRLIGGIDVALTPLIGRDLGTAFEVMIIQMGRYLRSLSGLILAKASRLVERSLLGDYSIISMAASELFLKGPGDAFKASLVFRSRVLELELSNSLRDTLLLTVISFTYAILLLVP